MRCIKITNKATFEMLEEPDQQSVTKVLSDLPCAVSTIGNSSTLHAALYLEYYFLLMLRLYHDNFRRETETGSR